MKGDTGAQGVRGTDGAQGLPGLPGEDVLVSALEPNDTNCPDGGLKVVGVTGTHYVCNGARGPQGLQGVKGDQGIPGVKGDPGVSVTGLSLAPGADANCPTGGVRLTSASGTQYVCNGVKGDQGIQGIQGVKGDQGVQGIQGVQGPPGVVTANAPLSLSGSTLAISIASASSAGALSAADWSAFNAKVSASDPRLSDARAPTPGSASYIQNGTALQAASFNVNGTAGAGSLTVASSGSFGADLSYGGELYGPMGATPSNPAKSCDELHKARPKAASGIYWLQPGTVLTPFKAYCDMVTDGGGWTLVWSVLRGGRGKPATELRFNAVTLTVPRIHGEPTADLESWEVFTGLRHWMPDGLGPNGQLRLDYSQDFGNGVVNRFDCPFLLDPTKGWTLAFDTKNAACRATVGTTMPGLVSGTAGRLLATWDVDVSGCAGLNSGTPWWYISGSQSGPACYNGTGSMSGSGESSLVRSGAYWSTADARDPGNAWLYVR